MLASFLGVLPILTPPLCAFRENLKQRPIHRTEKSGATLDKVGLGAKTSPFPPHFHSQSISQSSQDSEHHLITGLDKNMNINNLDSQTCKETYSSLGPEIPNSHSQLLGIKQYKNHPVKLKLWMLLYQLNQCQLIT
jgi:hypothetical protein